MTNEEIQRVMDFIIKQQESFAAGMEQMREESRQRQEEMRQRQALAEERISELESAAVNLYNATARLTEKMVELAESQAHTDQRVNVLIDILEQRRNGKDQE
jgi:acyl-[acyl carrier protein]--UDP-N-acetylglucosamine O-acyltransferase